ncbi:MAG: hypothetical protein AAGD43_09975 [Pseudomonadota bacterium]
MIWLWQALSVPLILVFVVLSSVQFGLPGLASEFGQLVCILMPLLGMTLICMRVPGALPSVAVFLFGLILDLSSQEPLGYWPLIFLIGTALAKLHPRGTGEQLSLRLAWLALVAVGLLCSFVIVESVYFLQMPEFGGFVGAMSIFLVLGWALELLFAVFGMVRLQVPENGKLERGET